AELVLEPTALAFGAAVGEQLAPVVVDFLLCVAADEERHRFVELEGRSAVQRHETLAEQFERRLRRVRALDARVRKHGCIEADGVFDVAVEPQEWGDRLHDESLRSWNGASRAPNVSGRACAVWVWSSRCAWPAPIARAA